MLRAGVDPRTKEQNLDAGQGYAMGRGRNMRKSEYQEISIFTVMIRITDR